MHFGLFSYLPLCTKLETMAMNPLTSFCMSENIIPPSDLIDGLVESVIPVRIHSPQDFEAFLYCLLTAHVVTEKLGAIIIPDHM